MNEYIDSIKDRWFDVDGFMKDLDIHEHTENGILFQLYFYLALLQNYDEKSILGLIFIQYVGKLKITWKDAYYKTPRPSSEKDYASHDNMSAIMFGSYFFGWSCHTRANLFPSLLQGKYMHPRDIILYGYLRNKLFYPLLCIPFVIMLWSLLVSRDPGTTMLWWMRVECGPLPRFKRTFYKIMNHLYTDWQKEVIGVYFKQPINPINVLTWNG